MMEEITIRSTRAQRNLMVESARGRLPQQRSICCALVLGAQCQSKDLLQLAKEGLHGHDSTETDEGIRFVSQVCGTSAAFK